MKQEKQIILHLVDKRITAIEKIQFFPKIMLDF